LKDLKDRVLCVQDLGRRPYSPVLELQKAAVEGVREGRLPDTLFLVEHEPVYTLGRNGSEQNGLMSRQERDARGIGLVRTGRGGQVTYHGPGQLVGYPILNLARADAVPSAYVSRLEQVLMDVLAHYGIRTRTDRVNRGVWVGDEKIAAIGVRITRRVTMHGFALNVTTDLSPYDGIIPCGIRDKGVTSIHRLLPEVEMDDVKRLVIGTFCRVFGYERTETS